MKERVNDAWRHASGCGRSIRGLMTMSCRCVASPTTVFPRWNRSSP